MFERYTEKARRCIFFARYEACVFGSPRIETEHLLLGITREDKRLLGPAAPVESIRKHIQACVATREKISTSVDLPLSEEVKRALAHGAEEAANLGHAHIATGHLLLGLMDEETCLAAAVLREHGLTPELLRETVAARPDEEATELPLVARTHWKGLAALFSPGNGKARDVYFQAQGQARKLGSPCLETKHLLLALLAEVKDPAELFFGASVAALREHIQPEPPRREKVTAGTIPPTDECRHALAYAVEEAGQRGQNNLGPEHLVLGLLREESCEAAGILRAHGVSLDSVRRALLPRTGASSSSDPSQGQNYV